eukprot:TRINITY_DN46809_c0_g1_i1.p1 TRINITY_DN46809_c0_g1~~TRINITY_DN46809_c0_g1_i1.p1  ORF type:complete len:565 (+),score=258.70 TRINITY_DN46809_c0_g1_i1:88-1695(+)
MGCSESKGSKGAQSPAKQKDRGAPAPAPAPTKEQEGALDEGRKLAREKGLSDAQFDQVAKTGQDTPARRAVLEKMLKEIGNCVSPAAVFAFMKQYDALAAGETGMMPESTLTPAENLESIDSLAEPDQGKLKGLIDRTVVLKLNGGLGTGMGLDKAKSLLDVRDGKNFLDFIAEQIRHTRKVCDAPTLAFVLMNSFSTEDDTHAWFKERASDLGDWGGINMVQNKVPKILQDGLAPATYEKQPKEEWCPPGHGDLYAALLGSGTLDRLIAEGKEYVFVSNSDNLGATLDMRLLNYFASEDAAFMMEVAERTDADKKGGHLAKRGEGLVLRESAQCPEEDEKEFQNVQKHRFFNTNNLWFKLSDVKKTMEANGGVMELPLIRNAKTVDPKDDSTPKVYQLETAMGAAIASFGARARAVVVKRDRFAPVKKCDDLLSLRSDVYEVTPDWRLQLKAERDGKPPNVTLGGTYKKIGAFEELTANGVPSMIRCNKLTFKGKKMQIGADVTFVGDVTVEALEDGQTLPPGEYADQEVKLPQ